MWIKESLMKRCGVWTCVEANLCCVEGEVTRVDVWVAMEC